MSRCSYSLCLDEIEQEVLEFLDDRDTVDPDEVARRFRLGRESVSSSIISKPAREGKINILASGNSETIRVRKDF